MSWDDYAEEWDQDEAARAYSVAVFDSLTQLAKTRGVPLEGARVLDFGCGTGLLTEKLAPLCDAILGVDISPRMIDQLNQKIDRLGLTNVTASTTKIEDLEQQDPALVAGGFDFVVCSSVCGFVEDYPGTVRSLVGLLKPGGVFVQWDWELNPEDKEPYGLTREQITAAQNGAGLEAHQVDTAFKVRFGQETMWPLMGVGQKKRNTLFIEVSGAGLPEVDGLFVPSTAPPAESESGTVSTPGYWNGKMAWDRADGKCERSPALSYSNSYKSWRICRLDGHLAYDITCEDDLPPTDREWHVYKKGVAPAPKVVIHTTDPREIKH